MKRRTLFIVSAVLAFGAMAGPTIISEVRAGIDEFIEVRDTGCVH